MSSMPEDMVGGHDRAMRTPGIPKQCGDWVDRDDAGVIVGINADRSSKTKAQLLTLRSRTRKLGSFLAACEGESPRGPNRGGKLPEQSRSFLPSHTGVRDALPIHQLLPFDQPLGPGDQIAFQHYADDACVSVCDLPCDIAAN